MHGIRNLAISLCCLFFLHASFADAASDLITALTAYQKTQGDFTQEIFDSNHNLLMKSSGSFALERPLNSKKNQGKFLWDITKPQKQTLIADGKNISFYDHALAQVTIKKQQSGDYTNSPAMLLAGDLQHTITAYVVQEKHSADQTTYQLKPINQESMFSQLTITFNSQKELSSMQVHDRLDQTTEIHFAHLTQNTTPELFTLHAPPSVDVINGN